MPTYPLEERASVVLDASGNGQVTIGPKKPWNVWKVASVGVQVSTNVLVPNAKVYNGYVTPGNFLQGSETGHNDSTGDLNVTLLPGSFVTVRWEGGDVGAIATATAYGQIEDPH